MIPKHIIEKIEAADKVPEKYDIRIGNAVRVHVKVREGEKERVQVFSGMIIAKHGGGSTQTFTVRRISHGVGVERVFPVRSPSIAKVEVEKAGHVRRAKLYYLRGLTGKQARLREETDEERHVAPAQA